MVDGFSGRRHRQDASSARRPLFTAAQLEVNDFDPPIQRSAFVQKKIPSEVRQSALSRLFRDFGACDRREG
jgi:hypothetical protein